ncbi:MAG: hypothetical protein K2N23_00305 [Clostridia bacterium]|nr:hypothetical protein [Clostridia bacterium]
MGRKLGGKNGTKLIEEEQPTLITVDERNSLPDIFTSIAKDFISIKDIESASGLSYQQCAKIVREIKAVSDIFHIAGYVHRTDYFVYLSRRFACVKASAEGGCND